jgi:hypothetical protein
MVDMDNSKLKKKISRAISKGVKYLLTYKIRIIEEDAKKPTYDGGATILLNFIQGRYGIDMVNEKTCDNLVKCAQEYMLNHKKPLFSTYDEQQNDLFDTNFLRDIYLQKNNQYPINVYIEKMEKYLQTGDGFISQLMPILDIFSQRQIRYLNVGLALFGLMEKNYEKTTENKMFKHLKKRISRELADMFNNKSNYDPLYLDTTKAYALFLLHLLEEDKRIDQDDYHKFVINLLKTQNSMGHWIHTDTYDSVNEINNTILTIFAVINLLNYYSIIKDNSVDEDNKESKDMIEGFEGGFLTQKNMDIMFASKVCSSTLIEIGVLLFMMFIFGYLLIKLYRQKNI